MPAILALLLRTARRCLPEFRLFAGNLTDRKRIQGIGLTGLWACKLGDDSSGSGDESVGGVADLDASLGLH